MVLKNVVFLSRPFCLFISKKKKKKEKKNCRTRFFDPLNHVLYPHRQIGFTPSKYLIPFNREAPPKKNCANLGIVQKGGHYGLTGHAIKILKCLKNWGIVPNSQEWLHFPTDTCPNDKCHTDTWPTVLNFWFAMETKQTAECLTCLNCVFSNVSLNRLSEKMHNHIDCICLTFLQRVFLNVPSNGQHEKRHSRTGCSCLTLSLLCVLKCAFKFPACEDA